MQPRHALPDADTIVLPGLVRTMDPAQPLAEAIALRGGRVQAVGTRADVLAHRGSRTRVIELPGSCALPGFHDAHLHLTRHGLELEDIPLQDTFSIPEALARIAAAAKTAKPGTWLIGTGFALQRWGVSTLDKADLDAVAARHPVLLRSQDHHSGWVNSAALKLAGIDAQTPDPEHGTIVRDARGEATGLLLELAVGLVNAAVPAPDAERLAAALDAAARDLASKGITTVHHMAAEPPSYWRALSLRVSRTVGNRYPLRVWASFPHSDLEHAIAMGLASGQGGDFFMVGGAKFFADGALGSRTAWMLDDYPDGGVGFPVDRPDVLTERFALALQHGFAPVTHAIGDAANRAVLDALEATQPLWRGKRFVRPRIEHVQHLNADDLQRLVRLGVVASMQPIHLTFDAASIRALFPERLHDAYRIRQMLEAGVPLAFGSDTPVASPDVIDGLRAATQRVTADGGPLGLDQAIAVEDALAAYTRGAAYAIGREDRAGMLGAGFDADVVIVDHDPVKSLDDLQVLATLMDGEVTHAGSGVQV